MIGSANVDCEREMGGDEVGEGEQVLKGSSKEVA
jgi:hypothetical protein